jgi:hypothetical protein
MGEFDEHDKACKHSLDGGSGIHLDGIRLSA